MAASLASEREEKEVEADSEDVPLHKLFEKGAKLIGDEIGIKEHQGGDSAGRGWGRMFGGRGRSAPRFQVQCSWHVLKLHNTYFGLSRRG